MLSVFGALAAAVTIAVFGSQFLDSGSDGINVNVQDSDATDIDIGPGPQQPDAPTGTTTTSGAQTTATPSTAAAGPELAPCEVVGQTPGCPPQPQPVLSVTDQLALDVAVDYSGDLVLEVGGVIRDTNDDGLLEYEITHGESSDWHHRSLKEEIAFRVLACNPVGCTPSRTIAGVLADSDGLATDTTCFLNQTDEVIQCLIRNTGSDAHVARMVHQFGESDCGELDSCEYQSEGITSFWFNALHIDEVSGEERDGPLVVLP